MTKPAAGIQANSDRIHVRLRDPGVTGDLNLAWKPQRQLRQIFVGTEPYGIPNARPTRAAT